MDGNKRTGEDLFVLVQRSYTLTALLAFFVANEYLRVQGLPGLTANRFGDMAIADAHVDAACGKLDVENLAHRMTCAQRQPSAQSQ